MTPQELAELGFRAADQIAAEAEAFHWKSWENEERMLDSFSCRRTADEILEARAFPGLAEKMSAVLAPTVVPAGDQIQAFYAVRRLLDATMAPFLSAKAALAKKKAEGEAAR